MPQGFAALYGIDGAGIAVTHPHAMCLGGTPFESAQQGVAGLDPPVAARLFGERVDFADVIVAVIEKVAHFFIEHRFCPRYSKVLYDGIADSLCERIFVHELPPLVRIAEAEVYGHHSVARLAVREARH